jgi:hypothetical protein
MSHWSPQSLTSHYHALSPTSRPQERESQFRSTYNTITAKTLSLDAVSRFNHQRSIFSPGSANGLGSTGNERSHGNERPQTAYVNSSPKRARNPLTTGPAPNSHPPVTGSVTLDLATRSARLPIHNPVLKPLRPATASVQRDPYNPNAKASVQRDPYASFNGIERSSPMPAAYLSAHQAVHSASLHSSLLNSPYLSLSRSRNAGADSPPIGAKNNRLRTTFTSKNE